MSNHSEFNDCPDLDRKQSNLALASTITRAASKQTYYTVRFLVDRDLVPDAYRAYAYFRWVDDRLDQELSEKADRLDFVSRQKALVDQCYRGDWPRGLSAEESLLVDLVRNDREKISGLQAYIRNMMAVMAFDAERRGRLIYLNELNEYTHWLAAAVTEALHYFIGHRCGAPQCETRYVAAKAAHITHMLRDAQEDTLAGYINIPIEVIEAHRIDPLDVNSNGYRTWVRNRVQLAHACFNEGKDYLAQVKNPRCRLAGYAYMARFTGILEAIERDGYRLRLEYPQRKRLEERLGILWSVLSLALDGYRSGDRGRALTAR